VSFKIRISSELASFFLPYIARQQRKMVSDEILYWIAEMVHAGLPFMSLWKRINWKMKNERDECEMRKVIVTEYVTLDGVFEDPGGGEGSKHGAWSFQFWGEEAMKYKFDELVASDALLLGRMTYEGFAKAWPTMKGGGEFADKMNSIPKYVVSKTLQELAWNNSHLISENIAEEVTRLKQQEGQDILVAGSGELVSLLMQHDLIDEYRLMVHPVVLGSGKRLFSAGSAKTVLKCVATKPFSTGINVLHYRPAAKEEQ
jgi:dihydrofolate reductase